MRAHRILVAAVVSAVAVVGCAGGQDEVTTAQGWLHIDDTSAWFVSLLDDDGELSGTSNLARLTGERVDVEHLESALSGTRSDDEIVVSVHDQTRSGRLDRDELALTYTDSSGALVDIVFRPGDATEYNAAVADLDATAAENRQEAAVAAAEREQERAAAEAREAEQEAQQRERDQAAAAAAARADELEWLTSEVLRQTALLDAELDIADPVTVAETDLGILRQEISELAAADCIDAEWEASDVTYAADNVMYSIESGYYTIERIADIQLNLADDVTELDAAEPSSSESDAAIGAAEAVDSRTIDVFTGWYTALADISRGTEVEVGTALIDAAGRCGITTTWDGAGPRH